MTLVLITALGVGGATVIGALIGLIFKKISHKFSDIVLSFAAGVMLAAAIIGLVIPSMGDGSAISIITAISGIFVGALFLNLIDKFVPHLHNMVGETSEAHNNARLNKVLLFVAAITIHNFPEGVAAGVGFGSENIKHAFAIAIGIAVQNIPEGMVIISPMLAAGVSLKKTFVCAMITGLVEVLGTFIGYFAVNIATAVLPFALSFAGGTMLYVISDEIIPETHSHGVQRAATYALLIGFSVMLVIDTLLA